MRAAIQKNDLSDAMEALKKLREKHFKANRGECNPNETYEESGSNYFLIGGPYPNYAKK